MDQDWRGWENKRVALENLKGDKKKGRSLVEESKVRKSTNGS